MRHIIKKSDLDKVLNNHIVYIYAGNEQENKHIIEDFKKARKPLEQAVLHEGDYSAYIKHNEVTEAILGIKKDLYFTDRIIIERKNGLDELASCFITRIKEDSQGLDNRKRLEYEFTKAKSNGCQIALMVEDANGLAKIYRKDYKSQLSIESFIGTLFTFKRRYKLDVDFIDKTVSARYIKNTLKYAIKDILINELVEILEADNEYPGN